jgi:hypothetical protein
MWMAMGAWNSQLFALYSHAFVVAEPRQNRALDPACFDTEHGSEFAFLVDRDNDGKARDLLPEFTGASSPLTWFDFVNGTARAHVVSPNSHGHGIGAGDITGDINGDGRNDILTPKGWFEAPADPRTGSWNWHPISVWTV